MTPPRTSCVQQRTIRNEHMIGQITWSSCLTSRSIIPLLATLSCASRRPALHPYRCDEQSGLEVFCIRFVRVAAKYRWAFRCVVPQCPSQIVAPSSQNKSITTEPGNACRGSLRRGVEKLQQKWNRNGTIQSHSALSSYMSWQAAQDDDVVGVHVPEQNG